MKQSLQTVLFAAVVCYAGLRFAVPAEKTVPAFLEGYSPLSPNTWLRVIRPGETADSIPAGSMVFAKLRVAAPNGKTIVDYSAANHNAPMPLKFNFARFAGDYADVMKQLHSGDSACFFICTDTLKKYSLNRHLIDPVPLAAEFDTLPYIGFYIRIDSVYTPARMEQMRREKAQRNDPAALRAKALADIQTYLTDNNLSDLQPDRNGIYYKELIPGKGLRVMPGMKVSVMYKGTFTDGRVFDTNIGKPGAKPLVFVAGRGMIPGFTECILRMKDGGKSLFILPPEQAYGEKGAGNIPPWKPLVYEVELKITDSGTRN
ncbi:MAG: FKBP-type peptidyl-prolyl cis-trans isomerase [Bacteroidetes bacterium]|nr:FKBP-type peptidyl-prolyl cis-trans isomerase [Bacteroidota bacterium]